jgi:hypothetical protein
MIKLYHYVVCILISDLLNFNSTAEQVYENNHGMKAWQ